MRRRGRSRVNEERNVTGRDPRSYVREIPREKCAPTARVGVSLARHNSALALDPRGSKVRSGRFPRRTRSREVPTTSSRREKRSARDICSPAKVKELAGGKIARGKGEEPPWETPSCHKDSLLRARDFVSRPSLGPAHLSARDGGETIPSVGQLDRPGRSRGANRKEKRTQRTKKKRRLSEEEIPQLRNEARERK